MFKRFVVVSCFCLFVFAAAARADEIFYGPTTGLSFDVTLHQVDAEHMQVTVTPDVYLTGSGNGTNHPGFAFNLNNDPAITVSGIGGSNPSDWTFVDSSDTTSGPNLGKFNYYFENTSGGTSAKITSLVFTVTDVGGISYSDFVKNTDSDGNYFVADIGNSDGKSTGTVAISGDPETVTTTPEPSSLMLLGTGLAGFAGLMWRKLGYAGNRK